MDINSNTTLFTNLNTTWNNNLENLHVHLDQIPLCSSASWPNYPYPLQIPSSYSSSSCSSSCSSLFSSSLMPSSGGLLNDVVLGEDDEEAEAEEEQLGAMKEMLYKIAAMQPVDIDPATIRKPKRRNVRISDDPQSVAARHRRERISEKFRILQRLVPGGTKMDTASMLDEAIRYVKFLKRQIRLLQSQHPTPPPPPQQCNVTNALPIPSVGVNNAVIPGDHWPFAPPNLLNCHTTTAAATATSSSSSALDIPAALGFSARDGSGGYDQES